MRFSRELWDGFEVAASHTERGLAFGRDVSQLVKKLGKLNEEYAAGLSKLFKWGKGSKIFQSEGQDYTTVHRWWMTMLGELEFLARKYDEVGKRMGALPAGFDQFLDERAKTRKLLVVDGAKSIKLMTDSRKKLFKAQKYFKKAHDEAEAAQERYDMAVVAKKSVNEVTGMSKKAVKAKASREAADKDYRAALEAANKHQYEYFEQKMPLIMDGLQGGDAEVEDNIKGFIKSFVSEVKPTVKWLKEVWDQVDKQADAVSTERDLREFMNRNSNGGSPPGPMEYIDPSDGQSGNIFGANLADIMDADKKKGHKGDVPIVVGKLLEAITKLGGCTMEGIFRISPDAGAVRQLRREIERDNYAFATQVKDANVSAACLKQWLRDLEDPIVPEKLYHAAMVAASTGRDASLSFLKKLPKVNHAVIVTIAKFLGTVDAEKSKMTVDNLAIVFGPCFLRCPSTDYEKQLVGAGMESMFARHVIEGFQPRDRQRGPATVPRHVGGHGSKRSVGGQGDDGNDFDMPEGGGRRSNGRKGRATSNVNNRRPSQPRARGGRKASQINK